MDRQSIPLTLSVKDESLKQALSTAVAENPRFRLLGRDDHAEGALLVFQPGEDIQSDIARLARAVARGVVRDAFLVTECDDPRVLVEAMRAGAREILLLPLRIEEFEEALRRYASSQILVSRPETAGDAASAGQRIAVLGVKHGLGTTTLAVNLAAGLRASHGVTLVDMARPRPEVPYFLDVEYAYSWAEVARAPERCDSAFFEGLLAEHVSGINLLPGPTDAAEQAMLNPDVADVIARHACAGQGHVVIDLSADLDEAALAVLRRMDKVFLTMELSLPCLAAARETLKTLRSVDAALAERVNLVAVRCRGQMEIGAAEVREVLGLPLALTLPEDPGCLSALNKGIPLLTADPKSPYARAVSRLCHDLSPSGKGKRSGALELLGRASGLLKGRFSRRNGEKAAARGEERGAVQSGMGAV